MPAPRGFVASYYFQSARGRAMVRGRAMKDARAMKRTLLRGTEPGFMGSPLTEAARVATAHRIELAVRRARQANRDYRRYRKEYLDAQQEGV